MPVISDKEVSVFETLNADDSTGPLVDDTAYLYGGNVYWDTDTAEVAWGTEDNDGSYAAGNGDADSLNLDFT